MAPARFKLRFEIDRIHHWAARYSYAAGDELEALSTRARLARMLSKPDLLELGRWKSARIVGRLRENDEPAVEEVTGVALSARCEELRVGSLLSLRGVGWPMASVILHFCHDAPYPILDFRALWSLGVDAAPTYTLAFWIGYTEHCRAIALDADVSMRVLDRALWQYSKERQPPGK